MNDQILDAIFGAETQDLEKPKFEVRDLQSADWCVAKVIQAEHRIQERKLLVVQYIEKLDAYLINANKDDYSTIEFFRQQLEPWVEDYLREQKRKSVKLPHGTAGFRQGQESIEVLDEERALVWCKENLPEAIKITESIRKTEIKNAITAGGAVPDGVKLKQGERRFYVKEEE
ncbi:MAG: host-nuclease inhibitor Gam family protein [Deltaproteobacteria bacterium]|nr:host-nuclease inhibitor Gam family protein [Deltaproteobacteria bacterium]